MREFGGEVLFLFFGGEEEEERWICLLGKAYLRWLLGMYRCSCLGVIG